MSMVLCLGWGNERRDEGELEAFELGAQRRVVDAAPDDGDHAAQEGGIDLRLDDDLLAGDAGEGLLDFVAQGRAELGGGGDGGTDAAGLEVGEVLVGADD